MPINEESRIKEQLGSAAPGSEDRAARPQTPGSPSLESQVQDLQKTLTPLGSIPKTDQKNLPEKRGVRRTEGSQTPGAQAAGKPRKKKGRVGANGQPIQNQQLKGDRQRTPIQQAAQKAAVSWGKRALAASLFGASIGGAFPFM